MHFWGFDHMNMTKKTTILLKWMTLGAVHSQLCRALKQPKKSFKANIWEKQGMGFNTTCSLKTCCNVVNGGILHWRSCHHLGIKVSAEVWEKDKNLDSQSLLLFPATARRSMTNIPRVLQGLLCAVAVSLQPITTWGCTVIIGKSDALTQRWGWLSVRLWQKS